MGGFEPPAVGLTTQCSTNELQRFGDAIQGRRPSPSGADLRNALRATPGEDNPPWGGSLDERPRAAAGLPPFFGTVPRYPRCGEGRQIPSAGIALSDVCSRKFIGPPNRSAPFSKVDWALSIAARKWARASRRSFAVGRTPRGAFAAPGR